MRRACVVAAILLLASCAGPPAAPEVVVERGRAVVTSESPVLEVVVSADGLVLGRREGSADARQLSVRHGADPGTPLVVQVRTAAGVLDFAETVPPDPGPLRVEIDVPAGQGPVPLGPVHGFTAVEGIPVQVGVVLTVRDPGVTTLTIAGEEQTLVTTVPGERRVLFAPITSDGPTAIELEGAGQLFRTTLNPTQVSLEDARRRLSMTSLVFPADGQGAPEPARPPGRVTLPADWWRSLLRVSGLGYRTRDPHGPWSFQGVTFANSGDEPLNLVVRSRVLDAEGRPAEAFRPRMREQTGNTGEVAGLLRVPAGATAVASLPFFVDAGALPEGASRWTREITATALGSSQSLWTSTEPLQVQRGSSWISLGFGLAVLGGLLGALLIALRLGPWIRSFRTADLVTIAVFGTLAFLVSGASALVSAAVGAILGPFQIFVTNLADDVLRYALLATLVTLLPRPGVAGLTVLLTWLMRGVSLGSFSPIDLVYVGGHVFWLEAFLWGAGITRVAGWADASAVSRWLRLGTAFGFASLVTQFTGLVVTMVMYRLFYAGWYVGAVLAGPGFLYVWIACALGTGFATSLRRVGD